MDNFGVILFVSMSFKKCCIYFLLNVQFSSQYTDCIDSGKLHVFVVIHKISKIANFIRNYLENDIDSEFTVKQKMLHFLMNFPNINKNGKINIKKQTYIHFSIFLHSRTIMQLSESSKIFPKFYSCIRWLNIFT